MTRLAVLLALLGLQTPIDPDKDIREFLRSWARSMSDVKTLRVRFVQTKSLKILRRPRVSQGLALLKEKDLLLRVRDAAGKTEMELAVRGDEARIHYPRLKRLEIYDTTLEPPGTSPFLFFGPDIETLPETYHLALQKDGPDRILAMRPRTKNREIQQVHLRFREGNLIEVRQTSPSGDSVRLEIKEFSKNPDIAADEVKLDVPKDTRIVRITRPKTAQRD